ncbi:MAG: 3-isopropylmalate dehydrogenase, partial [Deltaproteobacteria bacterium]|nr:3-isopropylmalate dehydrogenase [Deltaproteobacteria bacterium]
MKKAFDIAVIGGDGTGPEVVAEGVKVLKAAGEKAGVDFTFTPYPLGGDLYLKTGELVSEQTLENLKRADAVFLGAIGHPEVTPGILEKGILLNLRFALDQYVNLRPIKLYEGVRTPLRDKRPADIDFVVVRENTEGLYAGAGGVLKKGTPDEVAVHESINTYKGVERCIRFAFEYCR